MAKKSVSVLNTMFIIIIGAVLGLFFRGGGGQLLGSPGKGGAPAYSAPMLIIILKYSAECGIWLYI